MDSREAMASAALTAGWRWWGVDDREVLSPTGNIRADGRGGCTCWRYWPCGTARRAVTALSVGQMLADETHEVPLCWTCSASGGWATSYGWRRSTTDCGWRCHGPKWASADLRKLLLQMDGVMTTGNAVRFGALRTRAIVIPAETLAAAGVDLGEYSTAGG